MSDFDEFEEESSTEEKLCKELSRVINHFVQEFHISNAVAVGCLELIKFKMSGDAFNSDDDDDDDDDDDEDIDYDEDDDDGESWKKL